MVDPRLCYSVLCMGSVEVDASAREEKLVELVGWITLCVWGLVIFCLIRLWDLIIAPWWHRWRAKLASLGGHMLSLSKLDMQLERLWARLNQLQPYVDSLEQHYHKLGEPNLSHGDVKDLHRRLDDLNSSIGERVPRSEFLEVMQTVQVIAKKLTELETTLAHLANDKDGFDA